MNECDYSEWSIYLSIYIFMDPEIGVKLPAKPLLLNLVEVDGTMHPSAIAEVRHEGLAQAQSLH